MNDINKALENPIMRMVASVCWLLATSALLAIFLRRLFDLLGIFDSLFFERWWNVDRFTWIAVFLTLVLWVGLSVLLGFDQTVWIGAAGAFFLWAVLVRNIAFEVPEFLGKLVLLFDALLHLAGVMLGLLTLHRFANTGDPINFGASASPSPEPNARPATTMTQAPTPSPAPMPSATADPASQQTMEAGWYADPKGEATWRWWDGSAWTDNTN